MAEIRTHEEKEPERAADKLDGDSEPYVDPVLERQALRKFDCYVLPQILIMVLLAYLDRSNIGSIPVLLPPWHDVCG